MSSHDQAAAGAKATKKLNVNAGDKTSVRNQAPTGQAGGVDAVGCEDKQEASRPAASTATQSTFGTGSEARVSNAEDNENIERNTADTGTAKPFNQMTPEEREAHASKTLDAMVHAQAQFDTARCDSKLAQDIWAAHSKALEQTLTIMCELKKDKDEAMKTVREGEVTMAEKLRKMNETSEAWESLKEEAEAFK